MRSKKTAINLIVYSLYEFVSLANTMLISRLILQTYGSTFNGLTASVTQMFTLLAVLRSGLYGPTRAALFKPLADNNTEKISSIINATDRLMKKMTMIMMAFLFFVALLYPLTNVNEVPYIESMLVVFIIGASFIIRYFFGFSYQILLNADQRIFIHTAIQTIALLVYAILAVWMINIEAGFIEMKFVASAAYYVSPIFLMLYAKRKYAISRDVPCDYSALKQRKDALWHSISTIVTTKTDIIILTILTNLRTVSVYTVYNMVISAVNNLFVSFVNSFASAFGDLYARKEYGLFQRRLLAYEYATFAFISIIMTCTYGLLVPFIKLYTAGITDVNYDQPLFAALLVLAAVSYNLRSPYSTIVGAVGHFRQTKRDSIVESVTNITLTLILVPIFGISGALLGTIVANTFRLWKYIAYTHKVIIHRSIKDLVLAYVKAGAMVTCVMSMQQLYLRVVVIHSWSEWVLAGLICFLISFSMTLALSFMLFKREIMQIISVVSAIILSSRVTRHQMGGVR